MSRFSLDSLQDRHGPRWRWLAVVTVMLGTMASVLSATIVNVALPDIMTEFGVGQGTVHWLATGYVAAMTTTMLAASWLLDRIGIRLAMGGAMLLFTIASVLAGFSQNAPTLIGFRIFQGGLAGLMTPMAMYLVFRVFPREERGRAMGIYGMGVILAPALGPVLGGVLVDQLDWRFVLFAPAPVTLAGVAMVWRYLPVAADRPPAYPFDWAALGLLALALTCGLDGLNRLQSPEAVALILVELGVALAAALLMVRRLRRASHPLLNISLLRQPAFRSAYLGALALGMALFGSTYLIPLFAQTGQGFSATDAGLMMLPAGVVLGILFPICGALADRYPARRLISAGLAVFAASALLFAVAPSGTGFLWLALWAVLGRIGLALMMPALSTAALNPLAPEDLGQGSGAINFARQLGGAFGINLVALVIEHGEQTAGQAAISAFHGAWWLVAAVVLLALLPIRKLRS